MTTHRRQFREGGPGRRGFTLVELLVAVSVVAILMVGIGQIFGSVSKLVGTGSALAEVDQMSRTVEAQLRDDFSALASMDQDETFLAIRNTRLGDIDLDGDFEPNRGEIDLYLTAEDDEYDIRENLDPFERNSDGGVLSRAVTIRADEIMFIAQSGKGYASYQGGQAGRQVKQFALISWGHALRPPLDQQNNPPRRVNYADGYFGDPAGLDNRFSPSGNESTQGRNRYASDFILSRHALVLMGASAFGYAGFGAEQSPALLGPDAEIAMYPRDLEASLRFFGGAPEDPDDLNVWPLGGLAPDDSLWPQRDPRSISKPRLIRHGRTDICAMDREDVQRWLEGGANPLPPAVNTAGLPWTEGTLPHALFGSGLAQENGPLWLRTQSPQSGELPAYRDNLRGIQSAIAGMFVRKLVETEPPDYRFDPQAYPNPQPDPRDRRMDIHAILAEHCTNFEVAWSDGSVWNGGPSGTQTLVIDRDGDSRGLAPNEREISPGQRIWFDMDFTYRELWDALGTNERENEAMYPRPNPDPEMGLVRDRLFQNFPLAQDPNQSVNVNRAYAAGGPFAPLTIMDDTDGASLNAYSTKYNQTGFASRNDPAAENEYLAIWGFNPPTGFNKELTAGASGGPIGSVVGGYERTIPWTKPKLIRIRVTLQDSQDRLVRGKTYEYIFPVGLN